ncbi:uncharacterized protein LOC106165530 isoform X2 [Lingula anatina]|uniref:Uncharacterized protein LOC106165530 isoform X2 n=1 Tax=Lingula anatina TaxID=7574 RepID=A0A1S3ILW5_LINAN|nr:uncharacterized protein LOC106165530 isoform X2 [Lingula anatina]|eukprot:XP_013399212.1 uncharacterized protein LOC106165530 isoform X2 [Lingula anatina]
MADETPKLEHDWTSEVVIRQAQMNDVTGIFNLTKEVQWNISQDTIATLLKIVEEGGQFLVADLKGRVIGARVVFILDHETASVGFFVVKSEYRGKTVAKQIAARVQSIIGERNLILWSLVPRIAVNIKVGMQLSTGNYCRLYYCRGKLDLTTLSPECPAGTKPIRIVPASDVNAEALGRYDKSVCTFSRPRTIQFWLAKPTAIALAALGDNDEVIGYGVARSAPETFFISPLYADTNDAMILLLRSLLTYIPEGSEVDMYARVENPTFKLLLEKNKRTFAKMHEEPIRLMNSRRELVIPKFESIFAVALAGAMPV